MMISMRSFVLALLLAPAAAQVKVCPSTAATDTITIAGSVTAQPIATTWGAAYTKQCKAKVTVDGGGSGDGAKRVCGDTSKGPAVDIATMSRAWKSTEATVGSDGFTYTCLIGTKPKAVQIDVAIDGITVIVKKGSLADTCIKALGGLTFAQLRWIYSSYTASKLTATGWPATALANSDKNDKTHLFSEISKSCPTTEIKIVGSSSAFGSYTYFLTTILTDNVAGETYDLLRPSGAAYTGTLTDAATIALVAGDANTIGFISSSALTTKAKTSVDAIAIKNKAGYVAPSSTTIANATYPLTLHIYFNLLSTTIAKTKAFIEYGLSVKGTADVVSLNFSPLTAASIAIQKKKIGIV